MAPTASLQDLAVMCRRALLTTAEIRGVRLSDQARRVALLVVDASFGLGRPVLWAESHWPIQRALRLASKEVSGALAKLQAMELLAIEPRDGGWSFGLRVGAFLEGAAQDTDAASAWAELAAGRRPQAPELIRPSLDERRDAGYAVALGDADRERAAAVAAQTGAREPQVMPETAVVPVAIGAALQRMRRMRTDGPAGGEGEIPPWAPRQSAGLGEIPPQTLGEIPPWGGDSPSRTCGRQNVVLHETNERNVLHVQNVGRAEEWRYEPDGQHGAGADVVTVCQAPPRAATGAPKRFSCGVKQHTYTEIEAICSTRPSDQADFERNRIVWLARVRDSAPVVDEALAEIKDRLRNPRAEPPRSVLAVLYAGCKRIARATGKAFRLL